MKILVLISISGGLDPCNCTWSDEVASDIRRCLYMVSIQLTLLSAKRMYMYTTKEKERFFKLCYFFKKSETCVTCTVIIIINVYTRTLIIYSLIGRMQHNSNELEI